MLRKAAWPTLTTWNVHKTQHEPGVPSCPAEGKKRDHFWDANFKSNAISLSTIGRILLTVLSHGWATAPKDDWSLMMPLLMRHSLMTRHLTTTEYVHCTVQYAVSWCLIKELWWRAFINIHSQELLRVHFHSYTQSISFSQRCPLTYFFRCRSFRRKSDAMSVPCSVM